MNNGFTVSCNNCGTKISMKSYLDMYKNKNVAKGLQVTFDPEMGVKFNCNNCNYQIQD